MAMDKRVYFQCVRQQLRVVERMRAAKGKCHDSYETDVSVNHVQENFCLHLSILSL